MQNRMALPFLIVSFLVLGGCSQPVSTPESANPVSGNTPTGAHGAPNAPSKNIIERALAPKPIPIIVPAGTSIGVTMDQSISSKTGNDGEEFAASVATPVMVGEKEVIPHGARASGSITEAKSAGKFNGHAVLAVKLDSITVHGQTYAIRTSHFAAAGKGRGKRTAIGAGGGGAAGAIIGAIAGHGKGALIGGAVGAGAGTAGAALTGERDVEIRAETRLTFKLTEPLELK